MLAAHAVPAADTKPTSGAAAPPAEGEITLFAFDGQSLAWQHNLRLTLETPVKHPANPVVRCGPKGSPDYGHAILYGTVLRDGDKFRMWYLGMELRQLDNGQAPGWWRPMCYAESLDGVNWTKPNLGLHEFNGNKHNNICLIEGEVQGMTLVNDFLSILYEPHDPDPSQRYKAAYIAHMLDTDIRGGMTNVGVHEGRVGALITATSADGLSWKVVGDRPANAGGERFEVSSLYRHGNFYYASGQLAAPWCWLNDGRPVGRVMMTYRSPDFRTWSQAKALSMVLPEQITEPQPSVDQMLGGFSKQMHMGTSVWNRGNVIIGLHGLWQGLPSERKPDAKGLDGLKIDLGLCISNDGVHFHEPIPNFKFLEHGKDDEWDSVALLQGHAFVNVGDETYIWYSHWDCEDQYRSQEIGLATIRRDGFGYLCRHDSGDPGHVVTCLLPPSTQGGTVFLNLSGATLAAPLLVEVLDDRDQPIDGYSGEDAARVTESGTRVAVTWKAHGRLPNDRSVALRIILPDQDAARLYAAYVSPQG